MRTVGLTFKEKPKETAKAKPESKEKPKEKTE